MSFVPSFVNFLELVEALIDLSKFSASLIFTFIVASHIDRSLSFRSISNDLYSSMNLDHISFEIVVVEEVLAIESFTGDVLVEFFVKVLIPGLNPISGKTLAFELAD